MKVIELEINKVADRLRKKEIYISLDEKAKRHLVDKGFQPEMGARPLRRLIEQCLEDPLAEKLLMHPDEGRRVFITTDGEKLIFNDKEVFALGQTPPPPVNNSQEPAKTST
jgi:ATP-dependent Clp protease ATP-binding subunit ClpC